MSRGCDGEMKLLEFYASPQRLLTSSFFSTLLHPHLLPQGVNGYKIHGTHARVDPRVCAHVDQPAGFHTGRQNGLSWSTTGNVTFTADPRLFAASFLSF